MLNANNKRNRSLSTSYDHIPFEKPFICSTCEECFSMKNALDYHRRGHQLRVQISTSSGRIAHISLFSANCVDLLNVTRLNSEELFQCPCEKRFSIVKSLQEHVKTCTIADRMAGEDGE
jgi:hypothetical protein